jgi:hypothetical protein
VVRILHARALSRTTSARVIVDRPLTAFDAHSIAERFDDDHAP